MHQSSNFLSSPHIKYLLSVHAVRRRNVCEPGHKYKREVFDKKE